MTIKIRSAKSSAKSHQGLEISVPQSTDLTLDLIVSHEAWSDLKKLEALIKQAANAACASASKLRGVNGPFEVAINLSNDEQVKALNHQFRGKDKASNVLSFPFKNEFPELLEGPEPLGDIILALETITLEAKNEDKLLGHHIAHLVVHGILHLFDYSHEELSEAGEMEELERQILASLQIPSPYHDD
ncbi:MAG: rRNA maturation RNase YbeY [bacterium]|nr:rRNA maturation RNase YbeY [bacterium]